MQLSTESLSDGTTPKDLRDFYFGSNDAQILHDWVACINRDRYEFLKDERDAYAGLQDQFTTELESINKSMTDTEASKEDLIQQLAASKIAYDDILASLQRVLILFGTTEEDMGRVQVDGRKSSELCAQYFKRLLREQESSIRAMRESTTRKKKRGNRGRKDHSGPRGRRLEISQAQSAAQEGSSKSKEATELLKLELQQAQLNLSTQSSALQAERDTHTSCGRRSVCL